MNKGSGLEPEKGREKSTLLPPTDANLNPRSQLSFAVVVSGVWRHFLSKTSCVCVCVWRGVAWCGMAVQNFCKNLIRKDSESPYPGTMWLFDECYYLILYKYYWTNLPGPPFFTLICELFTHKYGHLHVWCHRCNWDHMKSIDTGDLWVFQYLEIG